MTNSHEELITAYARLFDELMEKENEINELKKEIEKLKAIESCCKNFIHAIYE